MGEILWRKYTRNFNPLDYPTTDMIPDGQEPEAGMPTLIVQVPAKTGGTAADQA